jgi:hypothetical protein
MTAMLPAAVSSLVSRDLNSAPSSPNPDACTIAPAPPLAAKSETTSMERSAAKAINVASGALGKSRTDGTQATPARDSYFGSTDQISPLKPELQHMSIARAICRPPTNATWRGLSNLFRLLRLRCSEHGSGRQTRQARLVLDRHIRTRDAGALEC